jgi:hypothetical protein
MVENSYMSFNLLKRRAMKFKLCDSDTNHLFVQAPVEGRNNF